MFIDAVREWRQSFRGDLRDPEPWLLRAFGIAFDESSLSVTPRNSIEHSPALRAIRIICESLSCVPWNLHERAEDGRKRILRDNDVHWLIHYQPNEWMSSAVFRQVLQLHALTHGNGYAFIERRAATGRPVALLPLDAAVTRPKWGPDGRLLYETMGGNGQQVFLNAADVIHIPWLSWDGVVGESPARVGKRSLGLGASAEEAGLKFFSQGMLQNLIIEQALGTSMETKNLENLKAAIREKFSGLRNVWKPLILQPGLTAKQLSVDPDKAQARELRELNVADVARIYGVPLHLLASLVTGAQSYASVEQFELIFLKHTMLPWYCLWEQEADRKLLGRNQQGRQFTKFNLEGLLRGDKLSRAQGNQIEAQSGALTIDEWRDLEDRDPIGTPESQAPLVSTQVRPLDMVREPQGGPSAQPAGEKEADSEALRRLYLHEARKVAARFAQAVLTIHRKHAADRKKFEVELLGVTERFVSENGLFHRATFYLAMKEAMESKNVETLAETWRDTLPTQLLKGLP